MSKIRLPFAMLTILALLTAVPSFGIFISDCPQKCTPNCPCSINCLGPFGPTTCGEAGQACTGFAEDAGEQSPVFLFAPDLFVAELDQPSESEDADQADDQVTDEDVTNEAKTGELTR